MRWINAALNGAFNLFFKPFELLSPVWGMLVISLVAGVLMLWIFGKVSDQETIRTVRNQIRGNLMAIRLFGEDVLLLFRLQGRILRQTLTYMRYALVPMLIMLVPVLLIIVQLNLRFDSRPLQPGERTLVKVELRDPAVLARGVTLKVPQGVTVETPPVRVAAEHEVTWRVRADAEGKYDLVVEAPGETVTKQLVVGSGWGSTSTLRTGRGWIDSLLYPGEVPIDRSYSIAAVEINYPDLPLKFFGLHVDWLLAFFVLSIVFGFAFKGVLGVEI